MSTGQFRRLGVRDWGSPLVNLLVQEIQACGQDCICLAYDDEGRVYIDKTFVATELTVAGESSFGGDVTISGALLIDGDSVTINSPTTMSQPLTLGAAINGQGGTFASLITGTVTNALLANGAASATFAETGGVALSAAAGLTAPNALTSQFAHTAGTVHNLILLTGTPGVGQSTISVNLFGLP